MNNYSIGISLGDIDTRVSVKDLSDIIDFANIKCGGTDTTEIYTNSLFSTRVQEFYDAGIVCGAYWTVGPGYWLSKQQTIPGIENLTDSQHPILSQLIKVLKNKAIYWLVFEVMEPSLYTSAGQVTDVWLAFYIRDLVERIQRQQRLGNLPKFKIGVYSRKTFVQNYPALEAYLGTQPDIFIWTAHWQSKVGDEILNKDVQPPQDFKPLSFGYNPSRQKDWQFWHFAGNGYYKYTHPAVMNSNGVQNPINVSAFNGDKKSLIEWSGANISVPTQPPQNSSDDINSKLDRVLEHLNKLSWLER